MASICSISSVQLVICIIFIHLKTFSTELDMTVLYWQVLYLGMLATIGLFL